MRVNDVLGMSIRNLWRRKTRTVLTTLGVVIGSASIILMISMGIGYEKSFQEALDMFGNIRIIEVRPAHGGESSSDKKVKLNDELMEKLYKINGVKNIMEYYSSNAQITVGRFENYSQIYGVDLSKMKDFSIEVAEGKMPQEGDTALIVGTEFSNQFYNPRATNYMPVTIDVLNESYRMYINGMNDKDGNKKKATRINVAAVLSSSGYDNYSVYMDKSALIRLIEEDERRHGTGKSGRPKRIEDRGYERLQVLCKDIDDVQPVTDEIKSMGVEAYSPIEYVNQQKQQIQMMQALLGGIGFISLLVAAIGITNTMIMSIYERTREIGVMKVLGAELKDIMRMFLVEAAVIGFVGGIFGIVLSYAGSFGINHLSQVMGGGGDGMGMMGMGISKSVIPLRLTLLALAFSTAIGLIAGIFPALRATRLSALEAIRNE